MMRFNVPVVVKNYCLITMIKKGKVNLLVMIWVLAIMLHTSDKTQDQQRFTTSEVAADWHELMLTWCAIQPSIDCVSEQLDPRCNMTDIPPPQSATPGLHP